MPIKTIVMVRRRADLTAEAFRDGYENSHARIAVRLFGHLWLSYQRNFLTNGRRFGTGMSVGEPGSPDDVGFDAISEYVLRDKAAQAEMARIGLENLALIKDDEARWFDQVHCWSFQCETVVSDLLDHSGAHAVQQGEAPSGAPPLPMA
jgi:hypothetical protein